MNDSLTPRISVRPQLDPPPEISLYRGRTLALLRRYFRLSIEIGRLPSLVGRELFGGRSSSCRIDTFENVVVFVHDMEVFLARLEPLAQQLIGRTIFQEYTLTEAAHLLRIGRRSLIRKLPDALDRLSEMLIEAGMLRPADLTRSHHHRLRLARDLREALDLQAGADAEVGGIVGTIEAATDTCGNAQTWVAMETGWLPETHGYGARTPTCASTLGQRPCG